jgi:hypothetical protein
MDRLNVSKGEFFSVVSFSRGLIPLENHGKKKP